MSMALSSPLAASVWPPPRRGPGRPVSVRAGGHRAELPSVCGLADTDLPALLRTGFTLSFGGVSAPCWAARLCWSPRVGAPGAHSRSCLSARLRVRAWGPLRACPRDSGCVCVLGCGSPCLSRRSAFRIDPAHPAPPARLGPVSLPWSCGCPRVSPLRLQNLGLSLVCRGAPAPPPAGHLELQLLLRGVTSDTRFGPCCSFE